MGPDDGECVFCDIRDAKSPAEFLPSWEPVRTYIPRIEFDDFGVFAFSPLNPVTDGHVLFVPNRHTPDAGWLPTLSAEVFKAAAFYANQNHKSYNLITSAGVLATQTIKHLHIHVVPRRDNDGLKLPWSEDG